MWKVGGVKMWFGGEMNCRCCRREEALVTEGSKTERGAQGIAQGKHFPKTIDWQNERD